MQLISIVIPCYNPDLFLLETIASARAQTHPSTEIVLVNDGSDRPESLDILRRAAAGVDSYIEQPNRGLPAARNAGFRAARGTHFVPLDADDLLEPEYAVACLSALTAQPDAGFAYSDYRVFGTRKYPVQCPDYELYRLLDENFLTYAALIPRDSWERAGGYDESMRQGYEDWEFWLRLGALGRFGIHIPRRLFHYRKHGPSLYDEARRHHSEIVAYIRRRHPELYEPEARAHIKARWAPSVCVVGPGAPTQTIRDLEEAAPEEGADIARRSRAPAFLIQGDGPLDPHSAELAALAVWAGCSRLTLPDKSTALSRCEFTRGRRHADAPASRLLPTPPSQSQAAARFGLLRHHLDNAGLLSGEAWRKHPLRSLLRLIPLRVKERINRAAGRPLFDLSFYLQFQPESVFVGGNRQKPLRYCVRPAERRRVALITPHLGPGGAETVLLEIAAVLREAQFEVLLIATQSRDARWSERWRSHADHVYDLAQIVSPEWMSVAIASLVANWSCDSLLVQNSLPGYSALPFIRRDLPEIRLIDLIHALDDRWDQAGAVREVGDCIDIRMVANRSVGRHLRQAGVPQTKIHPICAGIDLVRFAPSPARAEESVRRILFVGRLDPVKRPALLVDIAAELAMLRPHRDFRFMVAGDGAEAAPLKNRVRTAGLQEFFEFLGHVDDTPRLFAGSDVCVVPSRAEGIPLVVLEAMASARPVVASNVGSIHEAVDSECGILVEIGRDEAACFARHLDRLLNHPELRQKMGDAGRRKVEGEYDLRANRQTLVRAFSQISPSGSS